MVSGYSAKAIAPFVISARRFMPAAQVDIFLYSNSNEPDLRRLAEAHSVTLVPFVAAPPESTTPSYSLIRKPVAWRFMLANALVNVRAACTLGWLVIDARDVVFQRHVFQTVPRTWTRNCTTLCLESRGLFDPKNPGTLIPDAGLLASTMPALGKLNIGTLQCLLGHRQLARVQTKRTMINSGVLLGGGDAFHAFMEHYAQELWRMRQRDCRDHGTAGSWWWIPDQLLLNALVYSGSMGNFSLAPRTESIGASNYSTVLLQANEDGLVYNVGSHSLLGKSPAIQRYVHNVHNPKGSARVAVLHQYDRAPALASVVKHIYGPIATYWTEEPGT